MCCRSGSMVRTVFVLENVMKISCFLSLLYNIIIFAEEGEIL